MWAGDSRFRAQEQDHALSSVKSVRQGTSCDPKCLRQGEAARPAIRTGASNLGLRKNKNWVLRVPLSVNTKGPRTEQNATKSPLSPLG